MQIYINIQKKKHLFSDSSTADPDDQGICSSTMDSWEDNWLFQKKRIHHMSGSNNYHHHPVPVPMLVPNPCEVARPLIGDREADETSELSDYSNSALDELLEICNYNIYLSHYHSRYTLTRGVFEGVQ